MATDDERREVAERLRMTTSNVRSAYGPSVLRALGLQSVGHESGDFYTLGSVDRLADLIEPVRDKGEKDFQPNVTCDREALLALADGMLDAFRVGARSGEGIDAKWCRELHDDYVRRIREACGEAVA